MPAYRRARCRNLVQDVQLKTMGTTDPYLAGQSVA